MSQVSRNGPRSKINILGQTQNLQTSKALEGTRRNRGEIIVVKIKGLEKREISKRRDRTGEGVALKRERSELRQRVKIGRENAGEGFGI